MGIDLEKYEGHTPGPWTKHSDLNGPLVRDANGALVTAYLTTANAALVTDAPALLAEVVRLRADLAEAVQTLEAIEIAARMRFSPADILDENSPIREGMRAVLAKHGGGK